MAQTILKDSAVLMTPLLTLIFQASLNQGLVPDDWKKSNIILCHKKAPEIAQGISAQFLGLNLFCLYFHLFFFPAILFL